MAAPTYVNASTGATDAGGLWSHTSAIAAAIGNVLILHVCQDGPNSGTVTFTSAARVEDLAGNDGAWTYIGEFPAGGSSEALHHLWIGRALSDTQGATFVGGNSSIDDLYIRMYEFTSVSAGTTLATVIENATAGATTTSTGTSDTASDASVQTVGPDRLALNFVAVNDDNAIAVFTGQSGGTWAEAVAEYADSAGTDGAIQLQTAAMAAAGTVNGGTASITTADAWGVVGFALIGTTVAGPSGTFALTTPTVS